MEINPGRPYQDCLSTIPLNRAANRLPDSFAVLLHRLPVRRYFFGLFPINRIYVTLPAMAVTLVAPCNPLIRPSATFSPGEKEQAEDQR